MGKEVSKKREREEELWQPFYSQHAHRLAPRTRTLGDLHLSNSRTITAHRQCAPIHCACRHQSPIYQPIT